MGNKSYTAFVRLTENTRDRVVKLTESTGSNNSNMIRLSIIKGLPIVEQECSDKNLGKTYDSFVRLNEEYERRIDELSANTNTTKSEMIRMAINEGLPLVEEQFL